jgi:hypothetical protein
MKFWIYTSFESYIDLNYHEKYFTSMLKYIIVLFIVYSHFSAQEAITKYNPRSAIDKSIVFWKHHEGDSFE